MKPRKRDKKIFIKFTPSEFELLKENAYQMADCYGLDSRFIKLKGKRKISFYSWDLDCLKAVLSTMKNDTNDNHELKLIDSIFGKIKIGYEEIKKTD